MITDWKEIVKRVAVKMDIEVEEVEQEIKTYNDVLVKAIRNFESVDYELFLLGKLKPLSVPMNGMKKYFTLYPYRPKAEKFFKFFDKWQEVKKKGRWKIKGQFNPFVKKD